MQYKSLLNRIVSILFVAPALILSSCTDGPLTADGSHGSGVDGIDLTVPSRPASDHPGSNWKRATNKIAAIGTTDMSTETANSLASALVFGPGIVITNAVFTGGDGILGEAGSGPYVDAGVILSTGNVGSVAGPNVSDFTSTLSATAGDADLDVLAGIGTQDAAVLEFDFDCGSGALGVAFNYVFASDEYNEYVGTGFNDVFGFYLNGINIALLGGSTPVAINTVNGGNP